MHLSPQGQLLESQCVKDCRFMHSGPQSVRPGARVSATLARLLLSPGNPKVPPAWAWTSSPSIPLLEGSPSLALPVRHIEVLRGALVKDPQARGATSAVLSADCAKGMQKALAWQ